jgi:hypothetical protein
MQGDWVADGTTKEGGRTMQVRLWLTASGGSGRGCTVGHSQNAAVVEKCIMTVGLVLWDILLNIKTPWARLCKTFPPMVRF